MLALDFSNKLVLVTGGGRGIGWAITKALANAGADVAITYTSQDPSEDTAKLSKSASVKVQAFKCEVSKSADINKLVVDVEAAYGKQVDIGIANAGIALWKDSESNTDEEFTRIFEVNTFGAYYFARALARSWLGHDVDVANGDNKTSASAKNLDKQILFISSVSGLVAMTPQPQTAYNASKAALTMLSKSLAAEWAPKGIAVNSLSPGYVLTDMIANPPDEQAKAWSTEWQRRTPAGRFATPDEVGEAVALLVSSKLGGMGWMNGSDVVLDGGYTLY